jgi:Na+/proline symporter
MAYTRPDLLLYPTKLESLRTIGYILNNNAYVVNPQILQRLFAASSDQALRQSQLLYQVVYFLIVLPGVLIGITQISIPELAGANGGEDAFGLVANELISKGGFSRVVAHFMLAGSIAAIMSTMAAATMVSRTQWPSMDCRPQSPARRLGPSSASPRCAAL